MSRITYIREGLGFFIYLSKWGCILINLIRFQSFLIPIKVFLSRATATSSLGNIVILNMFQLVAESISYMLEHNLD